MRVNIRYKVYPMVGTRSRAIRRGMSQSSFSASPMAAHAFYSEYDICSRLWTCHAGSRGSAPLGVGRDLHGILMLTRTLAAAGRDFCGLATRFAVAWAFGALWFDFLVSSTRCNH